MNKINNLDINRQINNYKLITQYQFYPNKLTYKKITKNNVVIIRSLLSNNLEKFTEINLQTYTPPRDGDFSELTLGVLDAMYFFLEILSQRGVFFIDKLLFKKIDSVEKMEEFHLYQLAEKVNQLLTEDFDDQIITLKNIYLYLISLSKAVNVDLKPVVSLFFMIGVKKGIHNV